MSMRPALAVMGIMFSRASKTVSQEEKKRRGEGLAAKPEDQSLMPRSYMEGEDQLPEIVPCPPHMCSGTSLHTNIHRNQMNERTVM